MIADPAHTRGHGEGPGGGVAKAELLELMQAMEQENQFVKKSSETHVSQEAGRDLEWPPLSVQPTSLADNDRGKLDPAANEAAGSDRGPAHLAPPSTRTYVNFSTAQKKSKELRAAKITKKRGQVLYEWVGGCGCGHTISYPLWVEPARGTLFAMQIIDSILGTQCKKKTSL